MTLSRSIIAASFGVAVCLAGGLRADDDGPAKVEKKQIKVDAKGIKVDAKELLQGDGEAPKPQPKAAPVKKLEAKVSPDAKAALDAMAAAYKKVDGLELAGTMTADMLAGGQVVDNKATFTASFAAPFKFRHEMAGDIVVGSTGEGLFAFRPRRNDYKQAEAIAARAPFERIPSPMRDVLREQNPALLFTVVDDAAKYLSESAKEIVKAADVTIDGKPYTAIDARGGEKMDLRLLIDPKTHLVRRVIQDRRRSLEQQGQDDVQRATVTIDYATVTAAAAKPEAKQFAWAAPAGAKDAAAADAEAGEAVALVGKDAPDFTLNDLAGKPVTMKDQAGSVIVLDFWATWCGPCQVSLPGLNKLYKDLSPKGLKVYAVDLEESKEKVQPVAAKLVPDLVVLLDEKSEAAKKYAVSGIPQTVVIGKDGRVKKVFIGSGNETGIRAAVEKALAE